MHICSCEWLFALSTGMNITQSSSLLKCCSWKIKIRLALWKVWCLFSCILCSQPLKWLILISCILCSQPLKWLILISCILCSQSLKWLIHISCILCSQPLKWLILISCILCSQPLKWLILISCILCSQSLKWLILISCILCSQPLKWLILISCILCSQSLKWLILISCILCSQPLKWLILISCILCSQPLKWLILISCILCSQSRKVWMLIELYFVFPVLKCLLFIQLYFDFALHSAVFCVLSPSSSLSKIRRWVASGSPASLQHAASTKCQHRRWMGGAKAWLPCLSSTTLFEWSACSHPSTAGYGRTATMPTLSLPQLLKTTKGKCWVLHTSYGEQGMAQWLQRQTCDWKVAGMSPPQERGENFLLRGQLFVLTLISVSVPPQLQYPFHPHVTTVVFNDPACVCMCAHMCVCVCVPSVCVSVACDDPEFLRFCLNSIFVCALSYEVRQQLQCPAVMTTVYCYW